MLTEIYTVWIRCVFYFHRGPLPKGERTIGRHLSRLCANERLIKVVGLTISTKVQITAPVVSTLLIIARRVMRLKQMLQLRPGFRAPPLHPASPRRVMNITIISDVAFSLASSNGERRSMARRIVSKNELQDCYNLNKFSNIITNMMKYVNKQYT